MNPIRNALPLVLLLTGAHTASADVSVTGSARMGLIQGYSSDTPEFTSKVTITFEGSATADSGLSFGASVANSADAGSENGRSGTAWVKGEAWKLTMGDTESAAAKSVGQAPIVGFTELGNNNNVTYISGGGVAFPALGNGPPLVATADPSLLYSWSADPVTVNASVTTPIAGRFAWGLGIVHAADGLRLGLAAEGQEGPGAGARQIIGSVAVTRGNVTLTAILGEVRSQGRHAMQGSLGLALRFDFGSVVAFYTDDTALATGPSSRATGLGLTWKLADGARLKAGVVRDLRNDRKAFDLGLTLGF